MNNYEEIDVYINRIIFYNPDNNYYILNTTYEDEELVVVGNLTNIDEKQMYEIKGNYTEHNKYGLQFKAYMAQLKLISQEDIVVKFLSSNNFVGIGEKIALKIYQQYQENENIISAILENPNKLLQIKGLTEQKKEMIIEQLNKQSNDNGMFEFISQNNLDYNDFISLYNKAGIDSNQLIDILKSNPFLLLTKQVNFKEIDKIAKYLNLDKYEYYKLQGYLYSMLKNLGFKLGSTYLDLDEFITFSLSKINFRYDEENISKALQELIDYNLIKIEDNRIYEIDQYEAEVFIAEFINEFNSVKDNYDVSDLINNYQEQQGIVFNNFQIEAISRGVNNKLSIITGGPGTGKSTIVSALIDIIKKLDSNLKIGLVAPTGKASKRLNYLTNHPSMTIHKMLKYDLHSNTFGHDLFNPIEYDILIIDEASMIDNLLFANLLKASFDVSKIILLGDYNQLPSVAQGQILHDLINSKLVITTYLEQIYRQKQGSLITKLAYDILNRQTLQLDYFDNNEIELIDFNDNEKINKLLEDYANIYQDNDIQILAPMYRGRYGIDNLNNIIQNFKFKNSHREYNVGDYVLQLKNRNEEEVYNGDVGKIISIDSSSLKVSFDNTSITYLKAQQNELALAYALTVHKAQGNEYSEIILFLDNNSSYFVDNKIFYTACTRTKKKLYIIANINTINETINNVHNNKRHTYLINMLVKNQ